MKNRYSKLFLAVAIATASMAGQASSGFMPKGNDGRALMPDEWLIGIGQAWHFRSPPSSKPARELSTRQPTASEQRIIESIRSQFDRSSSKVILLGDGNKIVALEFKSPVRENDTLLSASIDKTITALSAGVAVCDGKIKMTTKVKEVLPELASTDIGESTLRDNLLMASGTTSAFDDSQSMTPQEQADLQAGRKSFMDYMKGRWSKQQGWRKPGGTFDYKSQDPLLVGMMVSAAYGNRDGRDFREWQEEHFFTRVQTKDRRVQGRDRFGYAWSDGNTRMTIHDWARLAVFVQESRKQSGCYGDFVREATTTQIKTDTRFTQVFRGYGYFTWTDNWQIPNSYSAVGYGGQSITWSTTNDKYVIVFSNSETSQALNSVIKPWLESK